MAKAGADTRAFALSRRHRLPGVVIGEANEGHALELAWDGHRVLVAKGTDGVRLVSESYRDFAECFPSLVRALVRWPVKTLVGEAWIAALDPAMRPSFELLRGYVADGSPMRGGPPLVLLFADLLHLDGEDLGALPLVERRARLGAALAGHGPGLALSGTLPGALEDAKRTARSLGVPGLLARADDPTAPLVSLLGPLPDHHLSAPARVTNADKLMYPRDGLTKQAVAAYYRDIAPLMLPLLRDRPVVCQRWPDGIDDFTWYQHRMPPKAPDYLRAVFIDGNRRIVIDDAEGLLWMVNQAALTFHGWASRVGSLTEPDWAIFDLDPPEGTPYAKLIDIALALRKLLEMLGLASVPKTSGQKGLHVLVPLAKGHDVDTVHDFARRVSRVIAHTLPARVTLETERDKRGGRVYLDHGQNFLGKSLVLPYSLRAVDGAPVSTPLAWEEVNERLDPRAFTLATLRARVDAKGDLAAPLLDFRGVLGPALARLPP
ncbi:MAG: non-homologous end-joining DNA ligase [Myxococcales bacterium]|nr:non-homologous end-joining DNA ligase [Myxococcales bacterium]